MNIQGQRILIFGDSISKHGADNGPEIWDVDQGSNRASGQPGDLLASLLLEQGAEAVRVDARVGRSAANFFGREDAQALLNADAAFRPGIVFIVLGTNEIGMNLQADAGFFEQLKSFFEDAGAAVWAIGPFTYTAAAMNIGAAPVVDMMRGVFGRRFIDGRELSVQEGRAGDGVHFGAQAAAATAVNMLAEIQKAGGILDIKRSWPGLAIGAAAVLTGMLVFQRWRGKRAELLGSKLYDDDDIVHFPEEFQRRYKFGTIIRSQDPGALDVAEDFAEEQEVKITDLVNEDNAEDQLRRDLNVTGSIGMSNERDPTDNTFVRWTIRPSVPPTHGDKNTYAHVDWEIAYHSKGDDARYIRIPAGFSRRANNQRELLRLITADAWAGAKAIQALPPDALPQQIQRAFVHALYPAEGKNVDRKPHLFGGLGAQRRPKQETNTTEGGPGLGPPRQGKLQIGRQSDSYKDLSWKRVLAEAKKKRPKAVRATTICGFG